MTEAQNESFLIPAPWTIMKTEDATNFIHLRDTYCVTGWRAAATHPLEVAAPSPTPIVCLLKLGTATSPGMPDKGGFQRLQKFFTVHEDKAL